MSTPEEFHAHLDVCHQCRTHPFALCATGLALLAHVESGWKILPDPSRHNIADVALPPAAPHG